MTTQATELRQLRVRSTSTALGFGGELSFGQWVALGQRIGRHGNASLWWLGDWLAFGRESYRRRYKDGVVRTGLEYKTLRNYAVVTRRFPVSRRRDALSFQHHAEVCALPDDEQDRWLEAAIAHGWSRNELRRRLRHEQATPPEVGAIVRIDLSVDQDRERRWKAAAEASDHDLRAWMIAMLDRAVDEFAPVERVIAA